MRDSEILLPAGTLSREYRFLSARWVAWLSTIILCLIPSAALSAEAVCDQDLTREFRELAKEVCGPSVKESGVKITGEVSVPLGRIFKKLELAGIDIGAKIGIEAWIGARQEDLVAIKKDDRTCRLELYKIFKEDFLSAGLEFAWVVSYSDARVAYGKGCPYKQIRATYTCDQYHLGWSLAEIEGTHRWYDNRSLELRFYGEPPSGHAIGGDVSIDGDKITFFGARYGCKSRETQRVPAQIQRCVLASVCEN